MKLALFALGAFAGAFLLHIVLWQARRPRSHTAALLAIFLGALPAALLLGALVPALRPLAPHTAWEYLLVCEFHVALALGYIVLYSAVEGDSPSCQIVTAVAASGAPGQARADLARVIDNESVLLVRVRAMEREKMVTEADGALSLTSGGRALARVYLAVEVIFGLPRGG
jgi:hypothetical protein